MELPRSSGWQDFIKRFRIASNAPVYVTESNSWGASEMFDGFDHITLYDAHHDSGYDDEVVKRLFDTGALGCGEWMVGHALRGVKLEMHYPTWKKDAFDYEPKPQVPVNRSFDTGKHDRRVYDAVYVCRSGAWTPTWEDENFNKFWSSIPGSIVDPKLFDDGFAIKPRGFDMDEVTEMAIADKAAMEELASLNEVAK